MSESSDRRAGGLVTTVLGLGLAACGAEEPKPEHSQSQHPLEAGQVMLVDGLPDDVQQVSEVVIAGQRFMVYNVLGAPDIYVSPCAEGNMESGCTPDGEHVALRTGLDGRVPSVFGYGGKVFFTQEDPFAKQVALALNGDLVELDGDIERTQPPVIASILSVAGGHLWAAVGADNDFEAADLSIDPADREEFTVFNTLILKSPLLENLSFINDATKSTFENILSCISSLYFNVV